jgi:monoamine oxidase
MDADVIVVGGGLAGVRAATKLKAGGASVLVLEARDRLGGRTHTRLLQGALIDVGAQFIGPGQPRMYQLVKELGLGLSPTPTAGKKSLELQGRVTTYSGTIPFLNPVKLLKLHLNLSRLERIANRVQAADPWKSEDAAALDAMTLADWQTRHAFRGSDIESLGAAVLRTVFGAEADEVSLLYFLWYIASNGGLMPLVETHGGFQQDRIAGGTQQIAERIGVTLGRDSVRLNAPVLGIAQDTAGVTVRTSAGFWRAKRVVVSVPLAIAGRIAFDPPLPQSREQLHRGVFMGVTIKVFAAYERPFWRERGLSGQAVGTSGALSVVFDNTTPDGKMPCLLGFVVGRAARSFGEMPPDRRRAQVLDELARFFGDKARKPLDYAELDWSKEEFSGGCPTGLFRPGVISSCSEALRVSVDRIHWAGTETARQCTGYMEGAVESGDRAAQEVLAAL